MEGLFNLLSLVYVLVAVQVIRRLRRAGKATFDDDVRPADRKLLFEAAFFLLTPPAVALHELGHATATWLFGGRVEQFRFALYWGSVLPDRIPPFSPTEYGVIAIAGPLVTLALGFGSIAWAVLRPGRPARNLLLITFGQLQLIFGLVVYPLMSVPTGWGDFAIVRNAFNASASHLGDIVIGAYIALAVVVMRVRSTDAWKRRVWRLTTHNYGDLVAAERRLAESPDDPQALKAVGYYHLLVDDAVGAVPFLERAVALSRGDAQLTYNLAIAELADDKRRPEGLAHLRDARRILGDGPDPEDIPGFRAEIEKLIERIETDPSVTRKSGKRV